MSDSVYSAGGVCSSIEAWNTTAVDIEELSSVVDGDLRIFVADVVKSFDAVGPLGLCTLILNIMLGLGRGTSLLLFWESFGVEMVAFLSGALSASCSFWLKCSLVPVFLRAGWGLSSTVC